MPEGSPRRVPALKVHQWLEEWDKIIFDEEAHQRRPDPYFYMFTLPASELRALSGIYRRERVDNTLPGNQNLNIQRRHDEDRSREIRKFIEL